MLNKNLNRQEVYNLIVKKNSDIENNIDDKTKRNTGSYYTNIELSIVIMEDLLKNVSKDYIENLDEKKFLEPCLGIGSFVFAYLMVIDKFGFSKEKLVKIINNIYVCEINRNAIEEYKELFIQFVYTFFNIELDKDYFEGRVANGFLFDLSKRDYKYKDINSSFPNIMKNGGFDIITTNPPYKNLKAELSKYTDKKEYEQDKELYSQISKISSKIFKYSADGIINLYKLFVEEIICNFSNDEAKIGLLIPNTILSDKTCEKIRTHILQNYKIVSINIIQENNDFVNAQQALCTMIIDKSKKTDIIRINNDFCNQREKYINVNIDQIMNKTTGNAIFSINEKEYELLNKLQSFPKIGDINYIINMRGEFDLTINKEYLQNEGKLKLLRGRNIEYYSLNQQDNMEFVSDEFLNKCSKRKYIEKERIACQQISNIHKERRINYAIIPKQHILGNSCNFLYVNKNDDDIDLYYMLGLLNSTIINWYFKLISSNNHINNYEIDTFPVPIKYKRKKEISALVKKYLKIESSDILEKIDDLIYESFEIEEENEEISQDSESIIEKYCKDMRYIIPEFTITIARDIIYSKNTLDTIIAGLNIKLSKFEKKVCESITEKYKKINNNEVLNHTTFKLSDLDLEMIRNVPQGGNWQNIPIETARKSKRLSRITETGGRTTLYGRIDYKKPSYTITTYFNRPGNGTYVHPNIDRVISVREASRFQSFKDDYYFYGNKTELLKQVGNAVPPILAKEIGNSVVGKFGKIKSIDLFCGAGGMTAGFKDAGIESVLGNDFNESACVTFKANNPEIEVMCDDITKKEVKQNIIQIAKDSKVEMICGGPPCQGFSYAGKRFIDDPRNQLFKDFIEVVKNVRPKIVIMENVEGILTFDKGRVYEQIHELYREMDYNIEGRLLLASNYGVPQKRKRVIIICVRKDLNILPEDIFPKPTTEREEEQITAYDAISDLEMVECGENVKYTKKRCGSYIEMLKSTYKYIKKIVNNKNEQLSFFD